ncbi:MAG: ribosome maturation factor RimM [Acidobacteriota bacterium]
MVEAGDSKKELEVESLKKRGKFFIAKLRGVDSIGEAEEWRGKRLFIRQNQLFEPGEDEFFSFQLEGCSVETTEGEFVGTVSGTWLIPNNEVLVVQGEKKEVLIPFHRDVCLEVNLAHRKIVIDPPPGLLDIDEI